LCGYGPDRRKIGKDRNDFAALTDFAAPAIAFSMCTQTMSQNNGFPWKDSFWLGFEPMDRTHQEFVELVDAMLTATDETFLEHLKAFIVHAERHFGEEHEWMSSTNFPATQCHHDEHQAVLKSLYEVQASIGNGGPCADGYRLAQELVRWFPGHADYMDSALAQWMVKRSLGAVPLVFRRTIDSPGNLSI
jgi:hemerythrin